MLKHLFLRPEMLSRLIFSKPDGDAYFVQATSQQKARRALPEEIIRQLFMLSLFHDYKYPEELIRLELPIQMGREKKRADIAVFEANGNVKIIIEVKVELDQDSMPQLMSYMAITGAVYGAIVSGVEIICVKRLSARDAVPINDLPIFLGNDTLSEPEIQSEHNPQQNLPGAPRVSIDVESFERNAPTHALITIKGHTLQLSNVELESYKKLRQKFLSAGVALDPNIKQTEWFEIFSQLLEDTPITHPTYEAEHGTNAALQLLEGLRRIYLIDYSRKEAEAVSAEGVFGQNRVKLWSELMGLSVYRELIPNADNPARQRQTYYFECGTADLLSILNRFGREHGVKIPFSNARQFGVRIANDRDTLQRAGWEIGRVRTINGKRILRWRWTNS